MEPGQRSEFSPTTCQLAEQYRMGKPIALYNMQLRWIRFYQMLRRVLLGTVVGAILFLVVVIALFFSEYLIVFAGHVPDLQERLLLSLPGTIIGLLGCGECLVMREMIARRVPAAFLVCTEGLLEIRPGQVDVTRWDEIRGPLQESRAGKRKRYKLSRTNRKPLLFGETFEDTKGLADLIRQQFLKKQP